MTSLRYLILTAIYIIGSFFIIYYKSHNNQDTQFNKLITNPTIILFISTFLFFLIIKYQENSNCVNNKLPAKYIFSQSISYSILAVITQYIYIFFLEQDCIDTVAGSINQFNEFTHVPESLFIAGFVLLINNLSSYLIYPKCN
jgi:hypothetical protein